MTGATPSRRDILGTLLPGFVGTSLPEWVSALLAEGLAGVCLFGENIESFAQLRSLTDAIRAANPSALIAIDEEGGDVTRLYYDRGSPFPGNAVLGRLDDLAATTAVAEAVGAALRTVGVNLDFAPDVDINSNPLNPVIGIRSFGPSAELVARHAAAWTRGLQSQGVAASIKHFPGHGDTAQDSHLSLPTVDVSAAELRERELLPFAASISAGALSVMTSHILLPQIDPTSPATFSAALLQHVLRGELGFEGVIVSDALDMVGASGAIGIPAAAVCALSAGCDLLCIGTRNTASQLEEIVGHLREAVEGGDAGAGSGAASVGALTSPRVREAASRVAALAAAVPSAPPPLAEPHPGAADSGAPVLTASRAAEAFRVALGVRGTLADAPGPWVVVRVEAASNFAVGAVPWGPFAALSESHPAVPVVVVTEATWHDDIQSIPLEACVVAIGRDNERRPEVLRLLKALRERQPTLLTVDMGWPGDGVRSAQVATFGASALLGDALIEWLTRNGVLS